MVRADAEDRGTESEQVRPLSQRALAEAELSSRRSDQDWTARDWIAAAGLFLATAGVILWQNAHVAVLWDFSYVLDSAVRMADGQMPYRDFPFVHAPLTFLIQAAIIKLTGRVFFHHALYAAVVGASSTVLTWRIALRSLRGRAAAAWTMALLLTAPLTVLGLYCILPLPSYDCDCAFWMLVAVWLLQRLAETRTGHRDEAHPGRKNKDAASARRPGFWRSESSLRGFAAGACACLPVFFKQNMGLPFLLAVVGVLILLLGARFGSRHGLSRCEDTARGAGTSVLLAVLAGVGATLLAAALLLHFTAGIGNYLHWTIQFAAQRRLPGLAAMLGVYHDANLLWTLPCIAGGVFLLRDRYGKAHWAHIAAFALLAAPIVFTLCSLWLYDDADERGDSLLALWPLLLVLAAVLALVKLLRSGRRADLRMLLPFVLLAAIHGTMMSQQLWGSTYALWPLLILLVAELIAFLAGLAPRSFVLGLTALVSSTLLVCGGFYMASEERLSYAQFPDGPAQHSAFPQLAGMATPGPYLSEFDELLRYAAADIPLNEGLILLPGEDPFYFVTGRTPQFPVLLFDPATDPYSPEQIAATVRERSIRWLAVKRDLQIKEDPTPQREATMKALMSEFMPAAHLRGYDVYRLKGTSQSR
jgi:hypothetical protein